MNRRRFLRSAAAASTAPAVARQTGGTASSGFQPVEKPNVLWLLADQHRAQAISGYGDPNVGTPNIDRCITDGVHFTNAISGFPLCCPFRGSLLTGLYAHKCVPGHEYPLPEGQPTLAQPFRQAGYHTAWFGKWHLGGWKEAQGRGAYYILPPEMRGGFDTWVGYENNNSQWDCWVHGGTGKDAFHYRLPGYETDELTTLFVQHLKERAAANQRGPRQPFFAALSVQPPHDPYVAPAEYMHRYRPGALALRPNVPASAPIQSQARRELAGYYAMVDNWDHNIGRILRTLEETGLVFETHVIILSDHGDMLGSHGQFRKMNPYEESIRIPFIIAGEQPRYLGRVNGAQDAFLTAPDIAPTTLGLCGIPKPSWMQGTDLSAFRFANRTRPAKPDSAYLQTVIPTGHSNSVNKPYRGVVTRDGWKYACFEGVSYVMYNLNDDPFEQVNVAHDNRYRAERRKLIERTRQWAADTGDQFRFPED
jgi:arylsulfatase A-like enzyme